MNKLASFINITCTSFFLVGCFGGGSSTSGGSSSSGIVGISSLDSLPAATGPVVGGGGAALVRHLSNLYSTTGTKLSTMDHTTFGATDSRAFCENSNLIKQVIKEAANPDKILCYISAMKSTGIIPTSENVYDGNWHHWELSGMDSDNDGSIDVTPLIKFRITRDSNGKISEFKMFSCFGDNSGSPVQTEYISQTFSGSSAVVTSKYAGAEAGPGGTHTFGSEVTASGAVNSNGQWISKNLVSRSSYQGPMMQSFNMYMNMNQYSDYLTLSGYQNGNYSFGGTTFNFDTKMESYIELLNAGSLSDLSLGHGSSKVDVSMGDGSSTYTDNNLIESWSGDTRDVILSGPYESNVSSASLISSSSSGPVSFSIDEQWNCDVSSVSATSANMSPGNLMATNMDDAMLACEEKFGAGDQWIDCSDVLGPP